MKQDIKEFLLRAKKQTYANSSGQVKSSRPQSYDLMFEDGDLLYIDSYLGTHYFIGEEAVWIRGNPVWAMNYSGKVIDEDSFSSRFLKQALMHPSELYPYRGQPNYEDGDYTYTMVVDGDFEWFSGTEFITYKGRVVYELMFHGGKVIDKHFD